MLGPTNATDKTAPTNVVTTDTDQTVTGTKTFTNCVSVQLDNNPSGEDIGIYTNGRLFEERDTPRLYLKTTKHKRGTPAGSNSNTQIYFIDSAGNYDAGIINRYSTGKDMRLQIYSANTKTDDSSAIAMSLYLYAFQSGVTCAVLEGQRDYVKTNTQDILTIGNLNSAIEIDGDKTWSGVHTFSALSYFEAAPTVKNTGPEIRFNNTNSLVSADGMALSLRGYDASHSYAQIDGYRRGSAGLSELHLYTRNASDTVSRLVLYQYDNGVTWAQAPTRTYNSANTSDIVTIGSLASNPSVVHTTGNEEIDGLKTFNKLVTISAGHDACYVDMRPSTFAGWWDNHTNKDETILTFSDATKDYMLGALQAQLTSAGSIKLNVILRKTDGTWKVVTLADNS